jgi:hypothetical protein
MLQAKCTFHTKYRTTTLKAGIHNLGLPANAEKSPILMKQPPPAHLLTTHVTSEMLKDAQLTPSIVQLPWKQASITYGCQPMQKN